MVKYTKTDLKKDLTKLNGLVNEYNGLLKGGGCFSKFNVAKEYANPTNPLDKGASNATALQAALGQGGGGYELCPGDAAAPGYPGIIAYRDGCAPYPACGAAASQKGGAAMTALVGFLCKLLAPVGKNSLVALAVLLSLNEVGKDKKNQRGGGLMDTLSKSLIPLGKNQLLVLVSLLLLNYFAHVHPKKSKTQRGGAFTQLTKLLAPMGVNSFTSSLFLLVLSEILKSNRKKKKSQSGGNPFLAQLEKLIMPLGPNTFSVAALLVILNKLYSTKSGKQRGGNLTGILTELGKILSPKGLNAFLTSAGLVALSKVSTIDLNKIKKLASNATRKVKKATYPKKGKPSRTHKGDKDYTTKKGDKDFHRKGKDVKKKRKPFTKKK